MMEHPLTGIVKPHNHDVLSGRGNNINSHSGNKYFRSLVSKLKVEYVATQKAEKGMFAKLIVTQIRALNPPGRFLKQNPETGRWDDIGEKKAVDKTRQALREDAPKIEDQLKKGELSVQTHVMARLIAEQARAVYEQMSGEDSSHGDVSQQNFNLEVPSPYDPTYAHAAALAAANVAANAAGAAAAVAGRPHFRDILTGNRISVTDTLYSNGSGVAASTPVQTASRSWMGNSLYIPNGIPIGSLQSAAAGAGGTIDENRLSGLSVMNASIRSSVSLDPNRMSGLSVGNNSIQYGQMLNMQANLLNHAYMQANANQMAAAAAAATAIPGQMPAPAMPPPASMSSSIPKTQGMTHRFLEALDSTGASDDEGQGNVPANAHDDGPAIKGNEVGSVPFPGGQSEKVGSEPFPGGNSSNQAQGQEVGSEPFLGGNSSNQADNDQKVGSEPFLGGSTTDQAKNNGQEVGSVPFPGGGQSSHGGHGAYQEEVGSVPFLGGNSNDQAQKHEVGSVPFLGGNSSDHAHEQEVGSVPFPGGEEEVGSVPFPGGDSNDHAHEHKVRSEVFPGGGTQSGDQVASNHQVGSLPFPGVQSEDQEHQDSRESPEPEDTFDEDMRAIRSSFRASLNIKDVFERNAIERNAHTRMSMCSRRSSCMSMMLRSSFMSSLESDEDERIRQSVHIPDVFKSRRDRRKSVLTESTSQLLATVFGEETANTVRHKHKRESILLRDALQPFTNDELMMSIGDFSMGDFGNSDMHMSQFLDQSTQDISNYVDNLAEGERRRMSRQFKMESIKTASERTLVHSNGADDMDQSMNDVFADEGKGLA